MEPDARFIGEKFYRILKYFSHLGGKGMKKAWLFSALGLLLVVLVVAAFVFARGYGMWGYGMGPVGRGGYGGGYGGDYYQGPQGGYGMGPGVRGGGYGMGPGMMGQGYGGGYGMGPGGGGRQGYGQSYGQSEECQKYFDESAGKRKELNNKRFEYFEAMRNPKTKPEDATKFEKEIWELQQQIFSKAPIACR